MWMGFSIAVVAAIALDLGIFHRKARRITLKEALAESAAWIGLALAFSLWVSVSMGHRAGLEFLTSYVVEKSLSIDNIFVFLLIFEGFAVPSQSQHKVLYCGVVGALVMRAIFVFGGVALLNRFHFVLFVFGAILIVSAVVMLWPGGRTIRPERNWLVRLVRGVMPVTPDYEGEHFFVRQAGKYYGTPLLLAVVAIEATDILFAVDSVPAVLAITRDTFLAYSSNVFAILGLRALYFALADLLPRFRFMRPGLAAILLFTGAKMLASERIPISTGVSLGVILGILTVMAGASALWPEKKTTLL
jgi:tellurite resistance protein TerC